MIKTTTARISLVVLSALVFSFVWHTISGTAEIHSPTAVTIAQEVAVLHKQTGAPIMLDTLTIAFRDDGSSANFTKRIGAQGRIMAEHASIKDLSKSLKFNLDHITQSVSTFHISDEDVARQAAGGHCLSSEDALSEGKQVDSIQGIAVWQSISERNGRKIAQWTAPELNCLVLERTVSRLQPDGQEVVTNTLQTLSIVHGTPLAHLFQVPSGFVERSPLELYEERIRVEREKLGLALNEAPPPLGLGAQDNFLRAEQAYQQDPARKPDNQE